MAQLRDRTYLYQKTKCRYCHSGLEEAFLDLGTMPLANSFLKKEQAREEEFACPLRLARCPGCGLVQLTHVVPPQKMFTSYLYVSSTTQTFQKHFSDYAKAAKACLDLKKTLPLAIDIGSNDGLLLAFYQAEGLRAVGVEPASNLSEEANRKGLTTLNDYFNGAVVDRILKDHGPADVISANNVFAHIDDIHDVCRNVTRLLGQGGALIIEFPYLLTMVEDMLFDMIYHEHLSYIAVTPLKALLDRFHLEIFRIEKVPSHGGSLRVFIQKQPGIRPVSAQVESLLKAEKQKGYGSSEVYRRFTERVDRVREELVRFVDTAKARGKSIAGYGAPAKGNTLINFCGLRARDIGYIVDDNPLKQNLLTPGAHIPVVPNSYLFEHPTDYVLILAWNFAEEIVKKLDPLRQKGVKFIVPLPEPTVI